MRRVIGVIGESVFSDPAHEALAEEVGRRIAEAGCILLCGGLGGVMEAAARGARGARGLTVGVLPGPQRDEANPYIDVAIATGMGQMRNVVIVLTADVLIAIGGGYGTLSEIGHALRCGKPVVGLRTWEAQRGGERAPLTVVETAEEAVRAALRLAAP
ncbi:MAG: TIGR00725 family protein [Armatimonadota bacterium]|nr:TIGR00725 family protein [Armatimonadota bacterium]MDR7452160.1 TIGR00725 family protein [Armatimonadota bacterium]MDR7468073.1 TIGR00725 family protein [Armatimonadota bacterium]MDR7494886.1 TIGR00725 family protein [Armatimonadota bacterium]MDR7500283.1 TIGR00725 family protein [Armatimonadota bacterium]